MLCAWTLRLPLRHRDTHLLTPCPTLPLYWRIPVQRCSLRIGVTAVAVCAVVGLSVLPVAHAHTSLSGRTFVHSHLNGDPGEHSGTLDHGDHHGGLTFARTFTIERTLKVTAPSLLSAAVDARPESRPLGRVQAPDYAPVIHGPPLRPHSLRAPPA